ncbi:hypothetical protein K438DRAFT_1797756 [Mycena galopus ATCC 62051]|nr:hypothetical protein K438DRAFT_1797756 [Mycena galopus ATCC 62051]
MTPVGFASYYGTAESLLYFQLTVSYPLDVAKCLRPLTSIPFEGEDQDSVGTEEGLWEMYIPVGQPAIPVSSWQGLTMMLEASVPISVVSSTMPEHPVAHYLTPQGALRPMLRSGVQLDMPASFPPAHPTLTVEDAADSSARLMRPGTIDPEQQLTQMLRMGRQRVPDPTKNYHDGSFAGLLWRKKMVAEERGIFPLPGDGGEGQEVFSVTP